MTLLIGLLGMLSAHALTPVAGLEWRPLSRADLVWVSDNRTTGTGVGELDGQVRGQLQAFGGIWAKQRIGLMGGLGIARLQSTTWTDDIFVQRHWGVVRPSLDLRVCLIERRNKVPIPWILAGVYGDIPSARDISNGFTEEEQATADEEATIERARIGGFGGRLGAGADFRLNDHLSIGFQYAITWHRGVLKTSEASIVSSWLAGDAALLLIFEWPRSNKSTKKSVDPDDSTDEDA